MPGREGSRSEWTKFPHCTYNLQFAKGGAGASFTPTVFQNQPLCTWSPTAARCATRRSPTSSARPARPRASSSSARAASAGAAAQQHRRRPRPRIRWPHLQRRWPTYSRRPWPRKRTPSNVAALPTTYFSFRRRRRCRSRAKRRR